MPLFHSNAIMVGWAVARGVRGLDCVAAQVLRVAVPSRRPPLRRDVRELRRQAAVLRAGHTRSVRTTPTTRCGSSTATRVHPRTSSGSPSGSARVVVDGFGSTEGGVAIARTPDTPPGALGPLPDGTEIVDVDTGEPCPPGVTGELVNTAGAGRFEGYYNDPEAEAERMAAASTTAATWPTATRTATRTSPAGSATGCASTARTSARHRSNGCCCATPTSSRSRCTRFPRPMSATR